MSKQGSNSELFAHENNALTARPQHEAVSDTRLYQECTFNNKICFHIKTNGMVDLPI